MPARGLREKVTTATRSPRPLLERLTLSGTPMPRMTSHSVWPSATAPPLAAGALPAALSASAFASPAPGAGVIPGQAPSALTRSSAVTGRSGVKGGVSIEMLRVKTRPVRENQSASRDRMSDALLQPASAGPSSNNASHGFRPIVPCTIDPAPAPASKATGKTKALVLNVEALSRCALAPVSRESALTSCPNITLRHDHGSPQAPGPISQIIINCPYTAYCLRCQRPRSSACQ